MTLHRFAAVARKHSGPFRIRLILLSAKPGTDRGGAQGVCGE